MTWSLESGRKAFLGTHRGMPDRSFWYYLLKSQGKNEELASEKLQDVLTWVPNLSNCPELDGEISRLLKDKELPKTWSDFLGSIFVGRTLETEVNADSKQRRGQAWVGISFQYTSAIPAYIAAYDRWTAAFQRRQTTQNDDPAPIMDAFAGIAISRSSWADKDTFAGTHPTLSTGPRGRNAEYYDEVVLAAEMFIIGHEYGHHLLGHTSKRAKSFRLTEHLRDELKKLGLYRLVFLRSASQTTEPVAVKNPTPLRPQNPLVLQKEELLADILGLELVGISRGSAKAIAVQRAVIGAVCALLAEADIKHHWFLGEGDTHPSTIDRIAVLLRLTKNLFHRDGEIAANSMLDRLVSQLAAFSTACLQASLHGKEPTIYPAPTWNQCVRAMETSSVALATTRANVAAVKMKGMSWEVDNGQ
ncbi:M48 family metalloprotease [Arthrobacter sp. UYCu712]|uniref:M48 family metalloprotease n=1 Tax=Arthrobacter sp. UYCu712 TaxID=3156340 RepID=UPI003394564D